MAHSTPNTLDADAGRLIRYLQRGGNKNYYTTFSTNGTPRQAWYDASAEPPALPAGATHFGVNPCTAIPETNTAGEPRQPANVRGRKEYIAALNCLFADFDAKLFVTVTDDEAKAEQAANGGTLNNARERIQERTFLAEPEPYKDLARAHVRGLAVQPSVIVASGGGYHCYWLLAEPFVLDTDKARERAAGVQRDWVTLVGGDDAAKDIARVLRVPGTLNHKYEPARPVTFVEQDYSRTYTLDALHATLPAVAPRTARTPRTNAPACHTDGLQPGVAQPAIDLMDASKAAAALARLSTARRDDYENGGSWMNVGMALKGLGAIGYELWHEWSKASPKYNVGDCERKWPTLRVGTPGGTDITLASLLYWAKVDAGEPVSTLDDAERLQLQDLQARDVQTQRIMAMKAPLSAKAVIVGMLPRLDARRGLVANKDGHTGSVAVTYGQFADFMNTSKATVARAIDVGEQAGLWRKDGEYKQTENGYDVLCMRLGLQPAFFRPELAQPIELNTHGGKRAGAGRKPKCPFCPPGTSHAKTNTRKTTAIVEYFCPNHGKFAEQELPPTFVSYEPDNISELDETLTYAPAEFIQDETATSPLSDVETNAPEFKMKLVNATDTPLVLLPFHLEKTRAELVPLAERTPALAPGLRE